MLPYDIIINKRDGKPLSKEEIRFFIDGYVKEAIPDYQMAAFLMAVFFRGMTDGETAELTRIMINSGDVVELSAIPGIKVDKHSTGGVGDTTTLILAPLVAAAGVPVAKMSGRGLGHTGGTLDKLESIPGFSVNLSGDEFIKQVNDINIAVIGQTKDLVPADRKMYALRDVTATIDSIPLIASSIMSKKLAAGTDAIVLDVKVGNGAFMQNTSDARELAEIMVNIGKLMERKVVALLTDMNQPLGTHIGNALEVKEAVEILQGQHKGSDLYRVSLMLGSYMLYLAGVVKTSHEGLEKLEEILESGRGLEKLRQMIIAQHGEPAVVDDTGKLPRAKFQLEVLAPLGGYLSEIDTRSLGKASLVLGAGRKKKGDFIDPAVGFVFKPRRGELLEKNQPIATIFANDEEKAEESSRIILDSIKITENEPEKSGLIIDVVK
ncbi:MAG: pyrimidine-nucleoside phosphorylase [Vulcanimicrobiota bacterium]